MVVANVKIHTQRRIPGDLASPIFNSCQTRLTTAQAERCTPKTTAADLDAIAYNLKKLLKFITAKAEPGVGVMSPGIGTKIGFSLVFWALLKAHNPPKLKNR